MPHFHGLFSLLCVCVALQLAIPSPVSGEDAAEGASEEEGERAAFDAAWQRVYRTIPAEPFEGATPDIRELHRFVGFVEGRLRVSLPGWWERTVLATEVRSRGMFLFTPYRHLQSSGRVQHCSDLWSSEEVVVDETDAGWRITVDDASVIIPDRTAKEGGGALGRLKSVAAAAHDDHVYVAFFGGLSLSPYTVYAIDPSGDEQHVLWESQVKGGVLPEWIGGGTGDLPPHWAEIVVDDGRVIVFGAMVFAAYIEVFDAETGEAVLRFTTADQGREW